MIPGFWVTGHSLEDATTQFTTVYPDGLYCSKLVTTFFRLNNLLSLEFRVSSTLCYTRSTTLRLPDSKNQTKSS